jgi:hypothetical protein
MIVMFCCSDFKIDQGVIKSVLDSPDGSAFAKDILLGLAKTVSAPEVVAYHSYNYIKDMIDELRKNNCIVIELKNEKCDVM